MVNSMRKRSLSALRMDFHFENSNLKKKCFHRVFGINFRFKFLAHQEKKSLPLNVGVFINFFSWNLYNF